MNPKTYDEATYNIRESVEGLLCNEDLMGQVARLLTRMIAMRAPLSKVTAVARPFQKTWERATPKQIANCVTLRPRARDLRVALRRGGSYL